MSLTQKLTELRNALYDFSGRNPLVHVKREALWWPQLEEKDQKARAAKCYQKATYLKKEFGLDSTLNVLLLFKWYPPKKDGETAGRQMVSPLFYRPCKIARSRKIETEYTVEIDTETIAVNPVLRHYFKQFFGLEMPEEVESVADGVNQLLAFFNTAGQSQKVGVKTNWDDAEAWELIHCDCIGNFNYKKSLLGADYKQILESANRSVSDLLLQERSNLESTRESEDDPHLICQLDESQKKVLQMAMQGNAVIQGPPGTGKSHTIVALIGALLAEGKKILFVSEKRSALEVVYQRLTNYGKKELIAYFNTDKDQKKAFYASLKEAWSVLNETTENKLGEKTVPSTLFDYYPDNLTREREKLGTNLNELVAVLRKSGKQPEDLRTEITVPEYASWKEHLPFLTTFEKNITTVFNCESIGEASLSALNASVFAEEEVVAKLETRLDSLREVLDRMQKVQRDFNLDESFDGLVKLALTASILGMVDRIQIDLLNTDSKQYRSFNSWAKKYNVLKVKLAQAEQANRKWSRKPSLSEITELMDLLTNRERGRRGNAGILGLLRRNPNRLKDAFRDFHSGIGDHTKIKLLEGVKLEWRLRGELEEVKVKLKHNLNINDPDNEINLIFNLRNKLDALSQNEYLLILEHPQSTELIKTLDALHPDIVKLNSQRRFLFGTKSFESIHAFDIWLHRLKGELGVLNYWLPEVKQFYELPPEIREFIKRNRYKIELLHTIVAYQNLLNETRFEPQFKQLTGWQLEADWQKKHAGYQDVFNVNLDKIDQLIRSRQLEAEYLLSRPGFKLKPAEKAAKKRYKAQKRLLVHEMGKKQRHLSVRKLVEETGEHLLEIQPVWMMNPLTVAEYLPCLADMFDVVIFDESSQVPLEDAIPSVYRAKQVVVVGDEQQMPPGNFFSSKEDTPTVLDAAEKAYPTGMLKWHYRSKHPNLIQFSNQEFYQGNLVAMPPRIINQPIELVKVKGRYADGKNEKEAEAIAQRCAELIGKGENDIAVIAFSREQEKTIIVQLKKVGLGDKTEGIRVRNLENVQGIEAAIVLISIGYGKNEAGEFLMKFGPVNQLNGANRLNVLFSRAVKKMIVFLSVNSTDFRLSSNRGVQLLNDFVRFCENLTEEESKQAEITLHQHVAALIENKSDVRYFPPENGLALSGFVQFKKGKRLLLIDPGLNPEEVKDVYSVLEALRSEFKAIKIVLSVDWWLYPDRTREEIGAFFVE